MQNKKQEKENLVFYAQNIWWHILEKEGFFGKIAKGKL